MPEVNTAGEICILASHLVRFDIVRSFGNKAASCPVLYVVLCHMTLYLLLQAPTCRCTARIALGVFEYSDIVIGDVIFDYMRACKFSDVRRAFTNSFLITGIFALNI